MAEIAKNKNDSLDKVIECINNKKSFLLEAGAGSGKTWSLIESLKYILKEQSEKLKKSNQQIVCITYTNVAKDEISERIDNNHLVFVRTIHEFLWEVIRNYQIELKKVLIEYNNEQKPGKKIEDLEKKLNTINIEYTQYGRSFENGRITHDDVIEFSSKIFDSYPKISKIVANKYPYIFVDEYQDTEERTVKLLIDKLLYNNAGNIVIGFFGDSMQKIYNQGIGVIKSDKLETITKEDNYRCSLKVIDLLNKIRPALTQKPSGKNVVGEISFFCFNNDLSNENNYKKVFEYLTSQKGWDTEKTKVLMLTHKVIANKLDYNNLLNIYDKHHSFGRNRLFEKEERFSDLFFNKIENLAFLYKEKKYGEFIQILAKEGFKFSHHKHKGEIKEQMDELNQLRNTGTIKQVLDYIFEKQLITKPQKIKDFENEITANKDSEDCVKKKRFYDDLMKVKYQEVINLGGFIEERTPFSTKHGVKGAEYENVLMVIDDNSWNQYSFNDVFSNNQKNQDRYNRTLNLLYVCCSRAKDKLAILALSNMDVGAMKTIENWFGKNNMYDPSIFNSK